MQHPSGVCVATCHSSALAEYPFQPARAAQADFLQSPDKAAASGGWSAQSPPPVRYWNRIHPQCAPTPPESAAVQQIEPRHFRDS